MDAMHAMETRETKDAKNPTPWRHICFPQGFPSSASAVSRGSWQG